MVQIRRAVSADVVTIMSILDEAKDFMRMQGFSQWTRDYPAACLVELDIELNCGYVLIEDDAVCAYGALSQRIEPCYASIDGKWLSDLPYAVIHRLAVASSKRGQGAAVRFIGGMELIAKSKGILSLRTDTHRSNVIMLHLLEKLGFVRCGIVEYEDIPNDKTRVAFEKLLGFDCGCKDI
ncbi:MAG: GNAT family N-acetyltransferase [Clostridia bacterium]|nr:GNAT family N-acetyltransferase [Clostridia bacterium]